MKNDPYQQTPHSLVFQLEGLVCKYHKPRQLKKKQPSMSPFLLHVAPGDFAGKHVLKLVEWFSGHCHAIKSQNLTQSCLQVVQFAARRKILACEV